MYLKRVRLMEDWGKFCSTKPVGATENVIQMTKRRERSGQSSLSKANLEC